MRARQSGLVAIAVLAIATGAGVADARTVRGVVYVDANADGQVSIGERTIANAVVAYETHAFAVTNSAGEFTLEVPRGATGIVWVRVPDGFTPGPVWAPLGARDQLDLGLRPRPTSPPGPLRFVVAADSHMTIRQPFWADLGDVALAATALDPPPAFFTILGDITQGNADAQFDLVDAALADLAVPYVPVPGNHDWYDEGETWFRRYGPDNYSFDLDGVHFVVWNLMRTEDEITRYLGAELARVAPEMPIVALTHAPPSPAVVAALVRLGVDYLLTGHTHANSVVDHGGLIELGTEPLMMGGLDLTPAGYRVVTLDRGTLRATHRAIVDGGALVEVVSPSSMTCAVTSAQDDDLAKHTPLIVAAELAPDAVVTARIDHGPARPLTYAGGWSWQAALPSLPDGPHEVIVTARARAGPSTTRRASLTTCPPPRARPDGLAWPQLGGGAHHRGAIIRELPPPLATRWTATVGGHLLGGAPAVAGGMVFIAVTDLADGTTGGVIALDAQTGATRWRATTPRPLRGSLAIVDDVVVASQLDGTVLGLERATGTVRWRHALGGRDARASTMLAGPTADGGDVVLGDQRQLTAIAARDGATFWQRPIVADGVDFPSLSTVAIDEGVVVGTFGRELSGLRAWDRVTGAALWRVDDDATLAIHAAPVIADRTVFVVSAATEVVALDLDTGARRWLTKLDPTGFDWGMATVGTPAIAHGILVVPTLYRDVFGVDVASGRPLWRFAARPGPLSTTHYRGRGEAGFAAAPVITGHVVWVVDTSGQLAALDLETGAPLWQVDLKVPVLSGLATSGEALIVASFDGTVRALTPTTPTEPPAPTPAHAGGCCDAATHGGRARWTLIVLVGYAVVRRRRRRSTTSASTTGQARPPAVPVLHA